MEKPKPYGPLEVQAILSQGDGSASQKPLDPNTVPREFGPSHDGSAMHKDDSIPSRINMVAMRRRYSYSAAQKGQ